MIVVETQPRIVFVLDQLHMISNSEYIMDNEHCRSLMDIVRLLLFYLLGLIMIFEYFLRSNLKRQMSMKALNYHLLPQPISVIHAAPVHKEFHARFDATNKLYRYHVIQRPSFLCHERGAAWHFKRKLDVGAMHDAAQLLLGKHDFTTFRDSECQANSPIKTLDRLDVSYRDYDAYGGIEVTYETEGRSFLHHQVRNMVGTLMLIGERKWKENDLITALAAKNRAAGGVTAPAEGLYLVCVDYDDG